jgi:hypothetical protein
LRLKGLIVVVVVVPICHSIELVTQKFTLFFKSGI